MMQNILRSLVNSRPCHLLRCNLPVYQQSAFKGKTVEETLGLPVKPKQPLNPYLRYSLQIRPVIVQKYPDASAKDIIKIIGEQWAKVDESTKKKLKEDFEADKAIYQAELSQYDQNLTPQQRKLLENEKLKISYIKEKKQLKQKEQELGKPKRPISSYFLFAKDKLETRDPSISLREWQRKVSSEWKQLPADQRQRYEQEAKLNREHYEQELREWEAKMIDQSNIDVVRNKSLFEPSPQSPGQDKSGKSSKKSPTHHSEADTKPPLRGPGNVK